MSDRTPDTEEPRPDAVRRSLRALAEGSASQRGSSAEETAPSDAASARPESVVDDAERAVRSAREAAAFLSAGHLPELDRAVAAAARGGDDGVAARGRVALESLRRLDAALNGSERAGTPDGTDSVADPQARDDHFHSGRGTVLGGTAQRPNR